MHSTHSNAGTTILLLLLVLDVIVQVLVGMSPGTDNFLIVFGLLCGFLLALTFEQISHLFWDFKHGFFQKCRKNDFEYGKHFWCSLYYLITNSTLRGLC